MFGHDVRCHRIAVCFHDSRNHQQQRPEDDVQSLQDLHAEAIPQTVFLREQIREGRILSIHKVQIKTSISQPNCTAHDQLEDCPQANAGKQNSKQPTAVGLGEQFKMDVRSLLGIGCDAVGTARNGSTERTGGNACQNSSFPFSTQGIESEHTIVGRYFHKSNLLSENGKDV